MRRAIYGLVAATLIVALLVGCGKSKKAGSPAPSSAPTTTAASTQDTSTCPKLGGVPTCAGNGKSALGATRERLTRAGYSVTEASVGTGNPPATAALEVALAHGGKVTIYAFASVSDATRAAKPFASLERTNPKQFELRKAGPRLYVGTVEEPATLPMGAFNGVVTVAEGA